MLPFLAHHIYERMTYIGDLIIPFFIEFHLEWQDDKHFVDVALDLLRPLFLPGPYLWRDIIHHPDPLLFGPFGYAHIEAGIVDKHQHIWFVVENVFFTKADIAENGRQMHNDLDKPHKGKVAVVLDQRGAGCLHTVAAPAAHIGALVHLVQLLDQITPVKVAASLTCYDIITHRLPHKHNKHN